MLVYVIEENFVIMISDSQRIDGRNMIEKFMSRVIKKPQLGFGIMRLPTFDGEIDWNKASEIIDEYMKGKFCYFDLHPAYMLSKAQDVLREIVVNRYPREAYYVANKMPYYDIREYRDYEMIFARELAACSLEYFDYFMLHALTRDVYEMHERIGGFEFLCKKKEEGVIKNIGFSFHDKPECLEEILQRHPEIDFVQLQINFYDWENPIICSKECYEIARKHGKEILVMEPIKGGSLARSFELNSRIMSPEDVAEISLQFVKNLDGIAVILSGMSAVEHVIANRRTLENDVEYSKDIYEKLRKIILAESQIPCTSCGYCKRECPKQIPIPEILKLTNEYQKMSGGKRSFLGSSVMTYNAYVNKGGRASECINCGKCESRCPQKVPIRKFLREASRMFENNRELFYTTERNIQILIYLLKQHGIKKIIISPGTTNMSLGYSIQQDDFFEVYSAPDERSAAYMACGLAEECGEPVALSCTGATASRNYISGLTEAYYRKLPVLAITAAQPEGRIGHNIPQMIDRTNPLNDIVKLSVNVPIVKDVEDEWTCEVALNKAILELTHRGGGPVHINLVTSCSKDFSVRTLPKTRVIRRITEKDKYPELSKGRIGIFCGAHKKWSADLTKAVDDFCEQYDAVVICDHTSNYRGKYGVLANLVSEQEEMSEQWSTFDVLIHLGNVSGAYLPIRMRSVWRVNADGALCDTFRKLEYVFETEEIEFFKKYLRTDLCGAGELVQARILQEEYEKLVSEMPEIPFSNVWVASKTASVLPDNSVLHLGILNSLRSWNYFEVPRSVSVYSNTGGFGIDGCVSSLIGASLANPNKLFYGVVGDLAFFYDMNSLGNRHVGNNLRLLLINNGCGTEFKNYSHIAAVLGEAADANVAAKGHYGRKSPALVKNYAEDLGFEYLSARTKEEYADILPKIICPQIGEKAILVEIFTNSEQESDALKIIRQINGTNTIKVETTKKQAPLRIDKKKQVILWGTGHCFQKNLSKVENYCNIQYVCDNNSKSWGKEIVSGVKVISPKELLEMQDIFVVIMLEDAKVAFVIANQLLDMGIKDFDLIYNWLEYADSEKFER